MKKKLFLLILLFSLLTIQSFAAPATPHIVYEIEGLHVGVGWGRISDATGYTLYYAPYPYTGPESIVSVEMGASCILWATLWDSAAFYVAVEAYNDTGRSGLSNIESFQVFSHGPTDLPDTGQTLCYSSDGFVVNCAGTGQDGNFSNNTMSFTNNNNGTVTDNITSLVWQQDGDNGKFSWAEATAYCENLFLAGIGDWRLPTHMELMGIVNYGTSSPAIDTYYFPHTNARYWSSSSSVGDSAWWVGFTSGKLMSNSKSNFSLDVRCVRGR